MSAWRERTQRGPARPRSVAAVVGAVFASLRATLLVECALLFLAGVWIARGAALLSHAGAGSGFALVLCGSLCALTWWLEHPLTRDTTARALDRRLRHHGALATAFELEQRHPSVLVDAPRASPLDSPLDSPLNSMEQLVRARVLARLRFAEALQALFPPLLVPVGAPVAAGLFLLLVLDAQRAPAPAGVDLRALGEGLERAVAASALEAGEKAGPAAAELRRLLGEVHALRLGLADGATPSGAEDGRESGRSRLAELDQRLGELLARSEPSDPLAQPRRAHLEEARAWLDALRTGLANGTAAGSLTADGAGGTISPPRGVPSGAPAAPGPMPPVPALAPPAPDDPTSGQPLGVQAGTFWPAEYDAVVERWIELSRAARDAHAR